jgi:type IV secretion system protein TrbG
MSTRWDFTLKISAGERRTTETMKRIVIIFLFVFTVCLSMGTVYADNQTKTPSPDQKNTEAQKTVTDNVANNTQDVTNAVTGQADFVYTYIPNRVYKIYCTETRITEIQLQAGESSVKVDGADSVQWIIDQVESGGGSAKQVHINIKPIKQNISTNFYIYTDRHVYHIEAYAGDFYTPIITWTYPQEEKLALLRQQEKEQQLEEDTIPLGQGNMALENLCFKYQISGGNYPWKPVLVFDDGSKTYIQMPAAMKSSEAPALFVKDGKTLALVNYRLKNNYYIVDRLGKCFEMHAGKEVVKIKKQK